MVSPTTNDGRQRFPRPSASDPRPRVQSSADATTGDVLWELVERAQAGDTAAFGELYRRTVDTVYRYAYSRTGNRQVAEDLTADTFFRALKAIGSLRRSATSPAAWLVTIMRNMVCDYYKSGRHRLEVTIPAVTDAAMVRTAHDDAPLVDAVVDQRAGVELWDRARTALNCEQFDVLYWRFLRGYNVTETAAALGKTEGATKALQYRALRSLERELRGTGLHPDVLAAV